MDHTRKLSQSELLRYSRHLVLPGWGEEIQGRLKRSRMLVVGAGGLGSPALLYLAAAGVGTIAVADYDAVDISNLQRQILYSAAQVGTAKVTVVAQRLSDLNDTVQIVPLAQKVSQENVSNIVSSYDLVIDGTDNIDTRYLLNDACVRWQKPFIYGAVFRFEGLTTVLACAGGPCFNCLYPDVPPPGTIPDPATTGVFGPVAGTIGTIQATEAIKLVIGQECSLVGKLLVYDALHMQFELLTLKPNAACPTCAAGQQQGRQS